MTTIFFYVLLFQIKDWDKICEEEGKMTSPIICYILLGVILFLNSATHIVRNKFKTLSNNILPSILPCQKIHLT